MDWILTRPAAADLPARSIVATQTAAFIKDPHVLNGPWFCTDGGHATDEQIERYLGLNARVLRVGTGEDKK